MVAVKHGKRPRFAVHEGAFEAGQLGSFFDRILGGDQAFKPLASAPTIEPEYLKD